MKKAISAILVMSLLLMAGCAASPTDNPTVSVHMTENEPLAAQTSVTLPVSTTTTVKPNINMKDIKGKVTNIFYSKDNEVLVSADKLYLYDCAKGKILAETALPVNRVCFVQPTQNGYAVIGENDSRIGGGGMVADTANSGTKCTFYDNNLAMTSEIALANIYKDGGPEIFPDHIAVSNDCNKIAFSAVGTGSLYLYDISKNKKTVLIAGDTSENVGGINSIEQIKFANNDKSIVFQAMTLDLPLVDGSKGFATCGSINIDGTGLVNSKTGDYSIYEMTNGYDTFALFSEDFRSSTGRLLKMDIKSGKIEFLKASEKKETSYAVGSDKGAYYATAMPGKNCWMVRIYETKTGKLVSEQKAEYSEEIYGARSPSVKVIDAAKTCIILLGHTQSTESGYPTKVFVNQF